MFSVSGNIRPAKAGRKVAAECDAQSPEDIVRAVFTAMDEFTQGLQTDDATVVALRVD